MSGQKNLSLFSPTVVRRLKDASYTFRNVTRSQLTESMAEASTEIWRTDPQGAALKSTQQVDVDWNEFENHCFFNSAESKVNVSFDRIINYYPFDGTKLETLEFVDGMSGYEKAVFDKLPKFIGSLSFSNATNQHLYFEDRTGYLFPEISRDTTGKRSVGLAIATGGSTIEFNLKIPAGESFDNQVIFQKLNTTLNHGMSIFASASTNSSDTTELIFALTSGSASHLTSSMPITKGAFHHCAFIYDNDSDETLRLFMDGIQVAAAPNEDFEKINFLNENVYIGSGSSQTFSTTEFLPVETFSGSIDELRVWNYPRTLQQLGTFRKRNVFADPTLALYYRFNEPTGSYTSQALCIDHSGNGLHGQIQNYSSVMRVDSGHSSSITFERQEQNPVLFPDYPDLITLNSELLLSASMYDVNNPNLITKLVPAHYFLEGQAEEGLEEVDGQLGDNYSYNSDEVFPGGGRIPPSQVLSSFLFIWASFFDEIKIYLDSFSKLNTVEHMALNTIPTQFLENLANRYGFTLPNAFANVHPSQYADSEAVGMSEGIGANSLKDVQQFLWRRLLAELPGIRREKGTIASVKSMMRALGINPDNSFRIREYGGRRASRFELQRKEVRKIIRYLDFSKGTPFMSSSNLTAWRHAPGHPFGGPTPPDVSYQGGTIFFTIGGTPPTNTLFTSASWAWEGHYKLNRNLSTGSIQSLFRLETSGSTNIKPAIAVNLLAISGSESANRPNLLKLAFSGSDISKLVISSSIPELFDGNFWHINVNHSAGTLSSSFSVRANKTNGRFVIASHEFSGSYPNDTYANGYLTKNDGSGPGGGAAGTYFAIGTSSNYRPELLNHAGSDLDNVEFECGIANPRFWTKALTKREAREHALNPFSVGVHNPLTNYNFIRTNEGRIEDKSDGIDSGSIPFGAWERLRFRTDLNQEVTGSDSNGVINIIDQSQNQIGVTGIGFTADTAVMLPVFKSYSILDPSFDIPTNINKVRIRSVLDPDLAEELNAESGNIFELDPRETVADDRRFSIEASLVQAVNEDMVNLFSDADFLSDILGAPESMFANNYPRLERLQDKYFHRLTDKVNHKEFFEFFKWFDDNFSVLLERLMPRTTNFLGVNFVIESHLLERHKFEYKQADVHIDLRDRLAARLEPELEGKIRTENQ